MISEAQQDKTSDKPKSGRILPTKWVFSIKRDENNKIVRFKARWVAKGFLQKEGIDYEETYAAVMRIQTSRAIMAYAIKRDLPLYHADVTTAFLNGVMDNYVQLPEGSEMARTANTPDW